MTFASDVTPPGAGQAAPVTEGLKIKPNITAGKAQSDCHVSATLSLRQNTEPLNHFHRGQPQADNVRYKLNTNVT